MSKRVSGLSDDHAMRARYLIARSALLTHRNRASIHYSQRPDRWEGIQKKLSVTKNQYPKHADCSSMATWMLWDAMHRPYGVRDLIHRLNWTAGYTGTMYKHGKQVVHDVNLKIGDCIFYGDQGGGIPAHVAVYIGGGRVFSHGSEAGPFIIPMDYRSDRRMSRRYI